MSGQQGARVRVMERGLSAGERVAALDWGRIGEELNAQGNGVFESLVTAEECAALAGLYSDESVFRSRVVMGSHGFGRGEY